MRDRLILIGIVLAAFGASLGSGFHFDDYAIFSITGAPSRSLASWTFRLNDWIGGRDPLGYHLLNLLLHSIAVLLAFECLKRMMPPRVALLAAAIFAVHPLQSEAVNYISARGVLLAAIFCLAAFALWFSPRRWITLPCLALALLADPVAPRQAVSAVPPVLTGGVVIWRYLRLFVVPYGFTIDPDIPVPPLWLGLAAWAALAALAWLAWNRKWKWLLAGLILLLPAALLPANEPGSDHRTYLAMIPLTAAAGLLLARSKTPQLAPAVICVLALISFSRTMLWRSDEALWREAVRRAPQKIRPKIQLARDLRAADALEVLAAARRIAPHDPRIANEIGRVLLSQGQPDGALDEFSHAIAADPRDPQYFNSRGVAFEMLGNSAAARTDFERALKLDPGFTQARENLRKLTAAQ